MNEREMGTLETLTADLAIHQKMVDEPNDVGGLSAQEMKEKFDEAGLTIQSYLNETLIPQVEEALNETLEQARGYADKKVVAVGGSDMAKVVYDTQGMERDVFLYAQEVAKKTLGDGAKFGWVCVASSVSRQYKAGRTTVQLQDRVDPRGLWDEEKQGFVMPEGAKALGVTVMARWAREAWAECRVKLVINGEVASQAQGPDVTDGKYISEGILLAAEVKGGDLAQIELEVSESNNQHGAVYVKYLKAEILL